MAPDWSFDWSNPTFGSSDAMLPGGEPAPTGLWTVTHNRDVLFHAVPNENEMVGKLRKAAGDRVAKQKFVKGGLSMHWSDSTFGKVPVRLARDSSHQYPLGVSMGQERWLELLDWADKIVWDVRAERQHSPATPDQREPCKRKNLHRSKRMASPAGFLYGGPIACKVARRFCGLSSRAGPRRSSERFALRKARRCFAAYL
jgi:hypothetical protein